MSILKRKTDNPTTVQTCQPPIESLDKVRNHAYAIRQLLSWDRVGVLIDEGPAAVVTLFLAQDAVVGTARFALSVEESVDAIREYSNPEIGTELRCWQGHRLTNTQLTNLQELTTVWRASAGQGSECTGKQLGAFFDRLERESLKKGREATVSAAVRYQVLLDAHGRCMFDGCGADLTMDPVTGESGNFATLAHNVAASEGGTRGVLFLSSQLANDPDNILLLCETHHRLVDTVAKADYPAAKLSEMRSRFCTSAGSLLEGLALTPIPAYSVLWPVHDQAISSPSSQEIARSMKPIGARLDGSLRSLGDNEALRRSVEAKRFWSEMSEAVARATDGLLMQAQDKDYRAALFAMGMMPALIALGAKLGNKCQVTPMLLNRQTGSWFWPENGPRGEFCTIEGVDQLSGSEGDLCLQLGLTAIPAAMRMTAESLGMPTVSIYAKSTCMGNGALGHPEDGSALRQITQTLLHKLKDTYSVDRVHVLPCASNAACVFFGQAFDSHHPELVIYDFEAGGDRMAARLKIRNVAQACVIEPVDNCQ